jgi:hypothetical protein
MRAALPQCGSRVARMAGKFCRTGMNCRCSTALAGAADADFIEVFALARRLLIDCEH